MPLSCNSNRDLTAIVEIARLLKPVSQVRILPGAPEFMQLEHIFQGSLRVAGYLVAIPSHRPHLIAFVPAPKYAATPCQD